jgi:uncharacterized protein
MAGVPLHDDQGTYDRPHKLTVYFDPSKIDAVLAQFGDKPWRGERPVVVPVLLVHARKPPAYVLSAEIPAGEEQRSSFATAADQFGMDMRIPNHAELVAWGAGVGHFPSDPPPSSAGQAIVAGTLNWSETLPGWIGKWRMRWQGADYAWGISGVNYDAMAARSRHVGTRTSGDAVFGHHNSRRRIVGGRRRKAGRNRVRAAPIPPSHSRERLAVSRVLWL